MRIASKSSTGLYDFELERRLEVRKYTF